MWCLGPGKIVPGITREIKFQGKSKINQGMYSLNREPLLLPLRDPFKDYEITPAPPFTVILKKKKKENKITAKVCRKRFAVGECMEYGTCRLKIGKKQNLGLSNFQDIAI